MRKTKWNPHDVESIRRQYQVPLKPHAPIEYQGRRGQVVGTDGQYIWIQLDGEQNPTQRLSHHPQRCQLLHA